MRIDLGEIVGGFEHRYDAQTVADVDTPMIQAIAASTGLRLDNSVTVEVELEDGSSWRRTFSASFAPDSPTCIFTTPNPSVLGVRIRGIVFAVDVVHPDEAAKLDIVPVTCAASDPVGGRMFLANDTEVYAFDGVRILWESRRVSLDGIRDLSYSDGRVHGIGTDVGTEKARFSIDAETGKAEGGFVEWRGLQRLDD